jgi:hypothetical protein
MPLSLALPAARHGARDPPFDVIGAAFFTPYEYFLKIVREFKVGGTAVRLATSIPTLIADGQVAVSLGQQVTVSMIIYGLRDLSGILTSRQLFHSAMRLIRDGLWKPALLEYATKPSLQNIWRRSLPHTSRRRYPDAP